MVLSQNGKHCLRQENIAVSSLETSGLHNIVFIKHKFQGYILPSVPTAMMLNTLQVAEMLPRMLALQLHPFLLIHNHKVKNTAISWHATIRVCLVSLICLFITHDVLLGAILRPLGSEYLVMQWNFFYHGESIIKWFDHKVNLFVEVGSHEFYRMSNVRISYLFPPWLFLELTAHCCKSYR